MGRFWLIFLASALLTAVSIVALLVLTAAYGPALVGTVVVFYFALAAALLVRRKWPYGLGIVFGTVLVILYLVWALSMMTRMG